ncbi:hypothetical protein EXN66_Car008532 [Channa argus]|uniref:Uncharacterized protein n=1 Tax=Channa argus TaxID=215402 RepID=A0A6G1PS85_CHAAH|nr:hypothetical protein EXN66_Car008532 [Channa argus]
MLSQPDKLTTCESLRKDATDDSKGYQQCLALTIPVNSGTSRIEPEVVFCVLSEFGGGEMESAMSTESRTNSGKRHSREAAESDTYDSAQCKVDPDHMFGVVGIVGTILNLLVVVLVYIYTPI